MYVLNLKMLQLCTILLDGEKPVEIDLLQQFHRVINVFLTIKPKYVAFFSGFIIEHIPPVLRYQTIIQDIARKMGEGMAEFLQKQVQTLEDYDKYCFYVAGLVGEGLSRLFAVSHLEG